jgi:hypothetical protein
MSNDHDDPKDQSPNPPVDPSVGQRTITDGELREIRRTEGFQAAMRALKERWAIQRRVTPPRMTTPDPPIYDEVYYEGVRAMDADVDTFVGPPLTQVHGKILMREDLRSIPPEADAPDPDSTAPSSTSSTVFLATESARRPTTMGTSPRDAASFAEPSARRPPYGETRATFDLAAARATLARTEHEPPTQENDDALWLELRLACDEVDRLRGILDRAHHLVDQTDPRDPVGAALTMAGVYGDPADDALGRRG